MCNSRHCYRYICASCFFWLRQLRRVRRSLDDESVKTLVHAFVTARADYCKMVLASSSRSVTDKLQRVMNAAARLVSGTRKYDRGLSHILHADLHWLDVADRVRYKLGVTVHRRLAVHHKSHYVNQIYYHQSRQTAVYYLINHEAILKRFHEHYIFSQSLFTPFIGK